MVRVRFAPSPTGSLHLGGLRTAFFNRLLANRYGGECYLRIEDTDATRVIPGSENQLITSLHECGIGFDTWHGDAHGGSSSFIDVASVDGRSVEAEGMPVGTGAHRGVSRVSFVRQSDRLPIYRDHSEALVDSDAAYPCFCDAETVKAMPRGYDRRCASMDKSEAAARVAAGESHVIRLKVQPGARIDLKDEVWGRVAFRSDLVDDAVLLKSDGRPTYHLASCVDDHAMGITHVVRGEEWLPSAAKHTIIHRALGWAPPRFAHLPLLHSARGKKLSKRDGASSVRDTLDTGVLPQALLNFVALLGWSPPGDSSKLSDKGREALERRDPSLAPEIMSIEELSAMFSLDAVNKAPAIVDPDRLQWINAQHMRILAGTEEGMSRELIPRLRRALQERNGDLAGSYDDAYLTAVIDTVKERVHNVESIPVFCSYFFLDPDLTSEECVAWREKNWDPTIDEDVRAAVADELMSIGENESFGEPALKKAIKRASKALKVPMKRAFVVTRHVVTGSTIGAGVPATLATLGREVTLRRIAVRPPQ